MNQPARRNKNKVKRQAVQNETPSQDSVIQLQSVTHHYEGAIPPPSILAEFDRIVPGSAAKIIESYIEEGHHRRRIETNITNANVHAQGQHMDLQKQQHKSVNNSDFRGQVIGFFVCVMSVIGSLYAGLHDLQALSLILAALPTAALVKEFFIKRG